MLKWFRSLDVKKLRMVRYLNSEATKLLNSEAT